jgi:hypothetical protein
MIVRNAAECARCGDVIESRYRHDYVSCKCGGIFVDGGKDYIRRGGETLDLIIDLIIYRSEVVDE